MHICLHFRLDRRIFHLLGVSIVVAKEEAHYLVASVGEDYGSVVIFCFQSHLTGKFIGESDVGLKNFFELQDAEKGVSGNKRLLYWNSDRSGAVGENENEHLYLHQVDIAVVPFAE